jgi:transposase
LGDTRDVLRAGVMTRAGREEGVAALTRRGHVHPPDVPRLVTLVADHPEHHHDLAAWRATPRADGRRTVQTRPEGTTGVTPREQRWVLERTNAWQGRSRRHRKDEVRHVEASAAMIHMSDIHLLLHRLAPCGHPAFHDREEAA